MSHKILAKRRLSPRLYEFWLASETIPKYAKPGQFLIIRIDKKGERIPLTIVETSQGKVKIIVKCIGKSTFQLAMLDEGTELAEVVGPLGNSSDIRDYGHVCVIGGGVGIAPLLPTARALSAAGNTVTSILGAASSEQLILLEEFEELSDDLILMTDDGSAGEKGLVTDALESLLEEKKVDQLWAIGPAVMMKFVSAIAADSDIPCWVSLNTIMVDGTGMCGACRAEVNGEIRFACVDGPEFDGRNVNWNELIKRQFQYADLESAALKRFEEEVGDLSWV